MIFKGILNDNAKTIPSTYRKIILLNNNSMKQNKLIENQQNREDNKLLQVTESQIQLNNSKLKNNKYVLATNIQMNEFLNQGFQTAYDHFYSHNTTSNELYNIKSQCNQESIICVGDADSYNRLLLVSCGSCLDILTNTTGNQTRLVNGAWWYFRPGKFWGFGFAPNSNTWHPLREYLKARIDCDKLKGIVCGPPRTCQDSNQLSWHLTGMHGGWRLGIHIYCYLFFFVNFYLIKVF